MSLLPPKLCGVARVTHRLAGSTRRLHAIGLVALAVGALWATPAAGKPASWSIQVTPTPNGATSSSLAGVSCGAPRTCAAVGSFLDVSGTQMLLAEEWKGVRWSIKSTPKPSGATGGNFNGVSCVSSQECTAVGSLINSDGSIVTLAERWNGRRWLIRSTPNPPGAMRSYLDGVSCASSRYCVAVGYFSSSSQGPVSFAERWDGRRWAIQDTAPAGFEDRNTLSKVSCPYRRSCMAVGVAFGPTPDSTGADSQQWDGANWQVRRVAFPVRVLNDVSCTLPAACTAVGKNFPVGGGPPTLVIERWDGTSWAIQSAPIPPGAFQSDLDGVSCASKWTCTAVGPGPLAEHWNGRGWTIQITPTLPGGGTLNSVSCTTKKKCSAVGSASGAPLAERYS